MTDFAVGQARVEKTLAHHGVKGMHWGVRKAGTGKASSHVKRKEPSKDHTKVTELRKEKTKTLSNDEIQSINKRLQLQRSYSELKRKNSGLTKGQEKVAVILAVGASAQAVYAFSKSPLGQAVKKQLSAALKMGANAAG